MSLRTFLTGLLVVAVAALMAFAGTASADTVESPTGTTFTGTISASAEGHTVLDNPIAKIECASTVSGSITGHGTGKQVSGPISSLTFTGCTDSWHVTVVAAGSLSVGGISGAYNGDVFSTGATIEATRSGISCRYATSNTYIGVLTGGTPATLDISASIPFHSGSVFCGSGATAWTGSYKVTSPASLFVTGSGEGGIPPISPSVTHGVSNSSTPAVSKSQCFRGAPVNCATGNQTEEQTDLVLGGRGPSMHLTRTYNSQAAAKAVGPGPWGYGWSGPYSSRLEIDEKSGMVTVIQENGATATFILEGGKFVAGSWVQATLTTEGSGYVLTLPNQEKLRFSSAGWLTKQEDRNGNAITCLCLAGGAYIVKDAAGRELKFSYTEGKVTSVEDPMGRKVKYAYESGNLVSVTLPGEETPRWKFKYDASHQMTEMTDGRGGITKTAYDASNRVKEQTDPMSRVLKFAYGESSGKRTTTTTEPNGSTTFKKFNEAGEPLEVVKAKGTGLERKATFEYDSAYRLVKATDPLSHSTTYEYNAAGDRTLEKDAEGNEAKWTYNFTHDVLTETTPKGEKTTYKRDAKGNLEAVERPAPGESTQKSTFKRAANGDLESATDPLGREAKFEYDTYGNLKAAINPAGDKTTWTYNKNGEQLTEVNPRGNEEGAKAEEFETKTERDAQGRPIKVTDPLGRETKFAYDKNSNLETVTNALGQTTKYTYSANDERTKVEKPNGNTTEFAYGSMGEVKSRTNGNANTTKYEYDVLGQLTETIDSLERKSKREYDAAGNLKRTEDALGRTTTYAYDNADRLKEVNYSEASTPDVTYKYDKNSSVVEMVDGIGTTTKVYDQLGRLTEVKNGKSEVVKYTYDLGNQQTELVYPNGKAVKRAFDKAGRLEKVTDWLGKETTFSYSRDSQLRATTFPATTTNLDEYAYNRAGEMTQISVKKGAEVLASMTYTLDKLGRAEGVLQKGLPGGETLAYEYDTANRLVKGAGVPYAYDAANNITKKNSVTYTYDKAGQIATASNASFAYNSVGERIKSTPTGGPSTNYSYNQAGNLISTQRTAEAGLSKINETYTYDGTGLRVSESADGVTSSFSWDTTSELPLLLSHGGTKFIYGPEGLPIEQINPSEEARFLHHDQQGSTRLITVASGNVGGTYHYGPYGTIESYSGTVTTPLGYGGQYRSPTSALIYLRARVYDSITGQFLSVDPMVESSGEPYTYAAGDPVNLADPTGLIADLACGCCPPVQQDATAVAPRIDSLPVNTIEPLDWYRYPEVRKGVQVLNLALLATGVGEAVNVGLASIELIPFAAAKLTHVFRGAHNIRDTPVSRYLLQNTVDSRNFVGTSTNGVSTYKRILPTGRQAWVEVWGGKINNGGINMTPK